MSLGPFGRFGRLRRSRRCGSLRVGGTRRMLLYQNQDGRCLLCKGRLNKTLFDADHIVPIHLGGSNHISNIQLLHKECHGKKSQAEQEARDDLARELRLCRSRYFDSESHIYYLVTPIPTSFTVQRYICSRNPWWRRKLSHERTATAIRNIHALGGPLPKDHNRTP